MCRSCRRWCAVPLHRTEHLNGRAGRAQTGGHDDLTFMTSAPQHQGRVRGPCFCARKTRGNRGNIGIAPPPDPSCQRFAQSGGWRLALGQMVGNVKGNEEGNDGRCSPRRSWCGSTTQLQRDRRPPRRRQAPRPCLWAPPPTAGSAAFFVILPTNMTHKFALCFYAHGPDRTFLNRPHHSELQP